MRDRFARTAEAAQREAEIAFNLHRIGTQGGRLAIGRLGLLQSAMVAQRVAQTVELGCKAGPGRHRRADQIDPSSMVALVNRDDAQQMQTVGVYRIAIQRRSAPFSRGGETTGLIVSHRHRERRVIHLSPTRQGRERPTMAMDCPNELSRLAADRQRAIARYPDPPCSASGQ